MIFLVKATEEGGMEFQSDYHRGSFKAYLRKHAGKMFKIQLWSNPVSDEMRGYVFGALIPFLRTLDAGWASLDEDEIYEMLKKNFNYFEAYNPVSKRKERFGKSTMSTGKENLAAMEFVMRIGDWVMENYGQNLPDPEEWKRFRDMPRMKNER